MAQNRRYTGTDIFQSFLAENYSNDIKTVESVFLAFSSNADSSNGLTEYEFATFLSEIFKSPFGYYAVTEEQQKIFYNLLCEKISFPRKVYTK